MVLVLLVVAGIAMWMRGAGATPGPRLTDDLAPAMLARAGFPETRHNVLALRERLGESFLAEARRHGAPGAAEWDRVAVACERARHDTRAGDVDLAGWPQRVLDEIAELDAPVAALVAHRCPQMLLETVGSGRGFLGGSLFAPLARGAIAVPAPRAPGDDRTARTVAAVVPTPRAAA